MIAGRAVRDQAVSINLEEGGCGRIAEAVGGRELSQGVHGVGYVHGVVGHLVDDAAGDVVGRELRTVLVGPPDKHVVRLERRPLERQAANQAVHDRAGQRQLVDGVGRPEGAVGR